MCVQLTFAGVSGGVRSVGISVKAWLAFLTLSPFGVVQTIADASASLARLSPRCPIKAAVLSVSVTLALWCEKKIVIKNENIRLATGYMYKYFREHLEAVRSDILVKYEVLNNLLDLF